MKIDKKAYWIWPQDLHRAKIIGAKELNEKGNGVFRLLFEAKNLIHPIRRYLAKRDYTKDECDQMLDDLENILGDDINSIFNLDGELITSALGILEGKVVDIEIEHYRGKNHNEPYCNVTQVRKAGTLIEEIVDDD